MNPFGQPGLPLVVWPARSLLPGCPVVPTVLGFGRHEPICRTSTDPGYVAVRKVRMNKTLALWAGVLHLVYNWFCAVPRLL